MRYFRCRTAHSREALGAIDQDVALEIAGRPSSAPDFAVDLHPRRIRRSVGRARRRVLFSSRCDDHAVLLQKQIKTKNLPDSARDPDNPAYKMQKYMLYGMPLIYVFSGSVFQIGVLVYWLTGNIWNIGQQTWLITTNPAPGSEAYRAREKRLREKRLKKGLPEVEASDDAEIQDTQVGQRAQPLGKKRSKKARQTGNIPDNVILPEVEEDEVIADEEVRGPDNLTDAERAQKRYERRMAERQRSKKKRKKKRR